MGKFLSTDPLFRGYPYYTPYQFAGNKPIWAIDLDGLEEYTKTSTRHYTIDYIVKSNGEIADGNFTIYDRTSRKTRKINSGVKRLVSNGEEGGAIFITKRWYKKTPLAPKNGLRQYRLVRKEYYGTGEFVPANPSDPNRPIDNIEEIKVKPVTRVKTEVDINGKTNVTKIGPKPTNKKEQAKDVFETITKVEKLELEVGFKGNRAKFVNNKHAEILLTPILEKLKANPNNYVELSPNTSGPKGKDLNDYWGLFADGDTTDELVENRGAFIKKWFTDRGANPQQVRINTDDSFNKEINVTGTLHTEEKIKVKVNQ